MKNMMIVSAPWKDEPSFRMIPITEDCPYAEILYDPNEKVLAIISKLAKDKPQMMPKLNTSTGQVKTTKGRATEGGPLENFPVQERVIMPVYYEYYIDSKEDIKFFIEHFAMNPKHVSLAVINTTKKKPVVPTPPKKATDKKTDNKK